jgi:NAD(P)H-flavin reductase/ferredoxin
MSAADVTILPFGETLQVEDGESVLKAILRQNRFVKYGCKHGGCSTCRAFVVDGDFTLSDNTSFSLSDADRASGVVLLCSTYAETDLVIDVTHTMDDLDETTYRAGIEVLEFSGVVDRREQLSHDIVWLGVQLSDGAKLPLLPGQYVDLHIPGTEDSWRSFSLANAPGEENRVDLIIKIIPDGAFSGALQRGLGPGDTVRLRGPQGSFALRWSHRPMVMVAGGSGIAPVWSMLQDLAAHSNQRPVLFCYGARAAKDLVLRAELEELERTHDWFTYVPALSEPGADDADWTGELGLITEVLARLLPDAKKHEAYMCGPPGMIDAAVAVLTANGCKPRHVYFDRFVPSG